MKLLKEYISSILKEELDIEYGDCYEEGCTINLVNEEGRIVGSIELVLSSGRDVDAWKNAHGNQENVMMKKYREYMDQMAYEGMPREEMFSFEDFKEYMADMEDEHEREIDDIDKSQCVQDYEELEEYTGIDSPPVFSVHSEIEPQYQRKGYGLKLYIEAARIAKRYGGFIMMGGCETEGTSSADAVGIWQSGKLQQALKVGKNGKVAVYKR